MQDRAMELAFCVNIRTIRVGRYKQDKFPSLATRLIEFMYI